MNISHFNNKQVKKNIETNKYIHIYTLLVIRSLTGLNLGKGVLFWCVCSTSQRSTGQTDQGWEENGLWLKASTMVQLPNQTVMQNGWAEEGHERWRPHIHYHHFCSVIWHEKRVSAKWHKTNISIIWSFRRKNWTGESWLTLVNS